MMEHFYLAVIHKLMPSSYSKKRKAESSSAKNETQPHPHGPLKRSGNQAKAWDTYIGGSLDQLPSTQIPQVKTVLRL